MESVLEYICGGGGLLSVVSEPVSCPGLANDWGWEKAPALPWQKNIPPSQLVLHLNALRVGQLSGESTFAGGLTLHRQRVPRKPSKLATSPLRTSKGNQSYQIWGLTPHSLQPHGLERLFLFASSG